MDFFEPLIRTSLMDTLKTYRTGTSLTAFPQTNPPSAISTDTSRPYYLDSDRGIRNEPLSPDEIFRSPPASPSNELGILKLAGGVATGAAVYKMVEEPLGKTLAFAAGAIMGVVAAEKFFSGIKAPSSIGPRIATGSEATMLAYEAAVAQPREKSAAEVAAEYRATTGALEFQAVQAEMQARQAQLQAAMAQRQAAAIQEAMRKGREAGARKYGPQAYARMPSGGKLTPTPIAPRHRPSDLRLKA